MTSYRLPFDRTEMIFGLSGNQQVDWIAPQAVDAATDPLAVVQQAIQQPVDGHLLEELRGATSAAIAINDKTRPVPHQYLLPPMLTALEAIGIPAERITLIAATGTHQPMPAEEMARIVPEAVLQRYRVISHDCDDRGNLVDLGRTSRGTPVLINRTFLESDVRLAVGNIEPHHFMGFSGGAKSVSIGLGGRETINTNHVLLMDPSSRVAVYDSPIRQDVEEIGQMAGIHGVLNAVLNGKKEIVQAFFGRPLAVMQSGIPVAQKICQTRAKGPYDLVIASVGGHPKDINLYQSQKALTHASLLTRDGGAVILAAACPEGSGSAAYEQFMEGLTSQEQVFEKFQQMGFRVGPHKAFQIARDATRIHIFVVSQMPDELVRRLLLTPAPTIEAAVELAKPYLPEQARIAILPRATNTLALSEAAA